MALDARRLDPVPPGQHNRSMGFLLKIILFGVAIYAVWKTLRPLEGTLTTASSAARRNLHSPRRRRTRRPPRRAPPPAPRSGERPQGRDRGDGPVRRLRGPIFRPAAEKCGQWRPPPGIAPAGRAALVSCRSAAIVNVHRLTFLSNVVAYGSRSSSTKESHDVHQRQQFNRPRCERGRPSVRRARTACGSSTAMRKRAAEMPEMPETPNP